MRTLALALMLATAPACATLPSTPPPPTQGYGAPYQGTGAPIYLKDSRNDWEIREGTKRITSEQALEAAGDPEYEARRQIAKTHNARLYEEGQTRRRRGSIYTKVGLGVLIVGIVIATVVPSQLGDGRGGSVLATTYGGYALASLGGLTFTLGYKGGRVPPPYHAWGTPKALDRPAYIREQTEALNEKLGAPPASEQPGGVDDRAPLAPGQRRPMLPRPSGPSRPNHSLLMRGGAR